MNQYLRMFNFLWRLKRVEYNLSASWRRWGMSARSFPKAKALHQDLHQAQTAISRMIHFIYQLQHYYLFEVSVWYWKSLMNLTQFLCIRQGTGMLMGKTRIRDRKQEH